MYLLYRRKKGDKDWQLLENTIYVGENVAWAWANHISGLFSEYKVVPIKVDTVHELQEAVADPYTVLMLVKEVRNS